MKILKSDTAVAFYSLSVSLLVAPAMIALAALA